MLLVATLRDLVEAAVPCRICHSWAKNATLSKPPKLGGGHCALEDFAILDNTLLPFGQPPRLGGGRRAFEDFTILDELLANLQNFVEATVRWGICYPWAKLCMATLRDLVAAAVP